MPEKTKKRLKTGSKRVLVVLFVPSVERDGATAIDQDRLVNEALTMFGRVFGGATAYPKAKGCGATTKEEVPWCSTSPWSSTAM